MKQSSNSKITPYHSHLRQQGTQLTQPTLPSTPSAQTRAAGRLPGLRGEELRSQLHSRNGQRWYSWLHYRHRRMKLWSFTKCVKALEETRAQFWNLLMFWKNPACALAFFNTEHICCLPISPTLLYTKVSCFTNSIKSAVQLQMTSIILPFVWLSWKIGEKSHRLQQEHNHSLHNAWRGSLFPAAQGKDPKG